MSHKPPPAPPMQCGEAQIIAETPAAFTEEARANERAFLHVIDCKKCQETLDLTGDPRFMGDVHYRLETGELPPSRRPPPRRRKPAQSHVP